MTDQHVIDLRDDGWTIMHPLSCRPNLFDCPVNRAAERNLTVAPEERGQYSCGLAEDGQFVIVSPVDTDPVKAAIDTVARHYIAKAVRDAYEMNRIYWEDYADLCAVDFDRVGRRAVEIASKDFAPEATDAAYKLLAARASAQEPQP